MSRDRSKQRSFNPRLIQALLKDVNRRIDADKTAPPESKLSQKDYQALGKLAAQYGKLLNDCDRITKLKAGSSIF